MQVSVTGQNAVKITRDVERLVFYLSPLLSNRRIEVYFEESITLEGKQLFQAVVPDPLILDLSNPKIVQALKLLQEVIEGEGAEEKRIMKSHGIIPKTNDTKPKLS